jgi:hypothetical protein
MAATFTSAGGQRQLRDASFSRSTKIKFVDFQVVRKWKA